MAGAFEWGCHLYRHCWPCCCSLCAHCSFEQVKILLPSKASLYGFMLNIAYDLNILSPRFFTGHSKNPDGTTQFVHGQTSVGKTMDGVVHIITAAVSSCWSMFLSFIEQALPFRHYKYYGFQWTPVELQILGPLPKNR